MEACGESTVREGLRERAEKELRADKREIEDIGLCGKSAEVKKGITYTPPQFLPEGVVSGSACYQKPDYAYWRR